MPPWFSGGKYFESEISASYLVLLSSILPSSTSCLLSAAANVFRYAFIKLYGDASVEKCFRLWIIYLKIHVISESSDLTMFFCSTLALTWWFGLSEHQVPTSMKTVPNLNFSENASFWRSIVLAKIEYKLTIVIYLVPLLPFYLELWSDGVENSRVLLVTLFAIVESGYVVLKKVSDSWDNFLSASILFPKDSVCVICFYWCFLKAFSSQADF